MPISELKVLSFRNIQSAFIEANDHVNVFYGENGSGKTSLLESIYTLSRAKSFRTSRRQELLNIKSNELFINASLFGDEGVLGLSLSEAAELRIRINGADTDRLVNATRLLPVQVITPEGFEHFWSSPKVRRSFFDFGLFHVEHGYQDLWSQYSRLLKQTNALLKQVSRNEKELMFWYQQLVETGQKVEAHREAFLSEVFLPMLERVVSNLDGDKGQSLLTSLSIRYKAKSLGLDSETLTNSLDRDKKYRQVSIGPNRADYYVEDALGELSPRLSRGQSKLLFYTLTVAMVEVLSNKANKTTILLVDDLPSEADVNTRSTMLSLLVKSNAQLFITAIEPSIVREIKEFTESVSVFHVEHGAVANKNMEQLCL